MYRILLSVVSLFICSMTYAGQKVVNVSEAGTLAALLTEEEVGNVEDLKLTGNLNGSDIVLLRKMCGADRTVQGSLRYLDISEANIVSGGEKYGKNSFGDLYTQDNVLGDEMFTECSNLVSISLPKSAKKTGLFLFSFCSNLKKVEFPEVPELGYGTFEFCTSLEKIDLPKSITKVGVFTFGNLDNLKEVNMPSVTEIGDSTFVYCPKLEKVSMASVRQIGAKAFFGINSIRVIYLPANLKSINEYAFALCQNLGKIYSLSPTAPETAEDSFNDIDENCTVYVPKGSAASYKAARGWSKLNIVESDLTGINKNFTEQNIKVISRYDLQGRKQAKAAPGISILKMNDGSTRKVWKR